MVSISLEKDLIHPLTLILTLASSLEHSKRRSIGSRASTASLCAFKYQVRCHFDPSRVDFVSSMIRRFPIIDAQRVHVAPFRNPHLRHSPSISHAVLEGVPGVFIFDALPRGQVLRLHVGQKRFIEVAERSNPCLRRPHSGTAVSGIEASHLFELPIKNCKQE